MQLQGSCHCGAVHFTVDSPGPQPYQRCYCSICRKAGGAGGFAINLLADNNSMKITGKKNLSVYQALNDGQPSKHRRYFCKKCGSHMWAWNENWPDLIHPLASIIDTPLPRPEHFVDIMLDSAAPWVALHGGENIERCAEYPNQSIEDWHKGYGLWQGED
ncbi:MAG: GFA family protein [Rhodospirillaceae bacterium]|nr:GFA family protein [Rhodospirillaceae bacterium]MBT4687893.1 GFA family protein [Rhodospirillaceae bacterium]MBT5523349.1 GFA family protein [Rhodospirillaceae bacterium]MBT6589975.1 GFA family protein [Rhodospirillaceae bacterium]MBT6909823.1 GFA family protein [Rhodospirillaceae bacterium]